jgi:hypothetical protein
MANRVYIQIIGSDTIFDAPLLEDVQIELGSNFSSWGELLGSMDKYRQGVNTIFGATGQASTGVLTIMNAFDLPRWQSTAPAKVQLNLAFYTKNNPETDVFYPMSLLSSLCILSENNDGSFVLPGINTANIHQYLSELGKSSQAPASSLSSRIATDKTATKLPEGDKFKNHSKLVSLEIPGVIYLQYAIIRSVQPKYSKQKTQSGYPLWGQIEVSIEGLYPASDVMFKQVQTFINSQKTNANTSANSNVKKQSPATSKFPDLYR